MKSAIAIQCRVGAEGLHHRLLKGLRVVGMVNDDITVSHDFVYIALSVDFACNQVAVIVTAYRTRREPVFLRVNQYLVVLCRVVIQYRL